MPPKLSLVGVVGAELMEISVDACWMGCEGGGIGARGVVGVVASEE